MSKRILLVDDDRIVIMILQRSMEEIDTQHVIDTCSDAKEALSMMAENSYNLLITDYQMPRMNGAELAKEVRKMSPQTQIVLMSAHDEHSMRELIQAKVGGIHIDLFLEKPTTIEKVANAIQSTIGLT